MSGGPGEAGGLEVAPDVAAVLHPEERRAVAAAHGREPLRCWSCGEWVERSDEASLAVGLDGAVAAAEVAHRACAPSRADLAPLVAAARADPQGLAYAQPVHRDAGAVLVWERTLDVRLRGALGGERRPYVDAHQAGGFHPMRRDRPVRVLKRWHLAAHGADLVLARADEPVDRFADAAEAAGTAWSEALAGSGHCLLIVGAGLAVTAGDVAALQAALRSGGALLALVAAG